MQVVSPEIAHKRAIHRPLPADFRSDNAYCRGLISTGSRSFYLASHLLPKTLRAAVYSLYAFCREADDAIDDGEDPFLGLAVCRDRLAKIYGDGEPDNAVDRALATVVADYALPRELLEALLEGFAWDAKERSYKDLAGVYSYSVRVAGSVGIMMSLLMGVRDPHLLARAADLGVAMQLSNIARDVGDDARNGRVYLPLRWLREVDLSPQGLIRNPKFSDELGGVVARLLSAAATLYARADSGIAGLPARCRPGIYAARLLYAEIGEELLRNGCDSISRRTVVPGWRKALLVGRSVLGPPSQPAHLNAEPLPQVRYLIRAVDALPAASCAPKVAATGDIEWILGIVGQLEQRDRQLYAQRSNANAQG